MGGMNLLGKLEKAQKEAASAFKKKAPKSTSASSVMEEMHHIVELMSGIRKATTLGEMNDRVTRVCRKVESLYADIHKIIDSGAHDGVDKELKALRAVAETVAADLKLLYESIEDDLGKILRMDVDSILSGPMKSTFLKYCKQLNAHEEVTLYQMILAGQHQKKTVEFAKYYLQAGGANNGNTTKEGEFKRRAEAFLAAYETAMKSAKAKNPAAIADAQALQVKLAEFVKFVGNDYKKELLAHIHESVMSKFLRLNQTETLKALLTANI